MGQSQMVPPMTCHIPPDRCRTPLTLSLLFLLLFSLSAVASERARQPRESRGFTLTGTAILSGGLSLPPELES